MNKNIFLFFIVLVFGAKTNAAVWRVNNTDNTANFNEIQAAHDDSRVIAGDTLYIEGSTANYSSFICTKRLVIFGPGYFVSDNSTQANSLPATMNGSITFGPGSDGSVISGMSPNVIIIKANNISCQNNYISIGLHIYGVNGGRIWSNYIAALTDYEVHSSISCNNNIFVGNISMYQSSQFASFNNNIIKYIPKYLTIYSATFRNNIFTYEYQTPPNYGPPTILSSSIVNNISRVRFFDDTNLVVSNIDALFIGGSSRDGKYKLSETSAAKGAGFNGTDCGIFGGTNPYILGGLPPIPTITFLEVEDAATQETGLKISIKAKSN